MLNNLQPDIEIWLPVKNYEGLYEISNFGNVRASEKQVKCRGGKPRKIPAKLCKTYIDKKSGYVCKSFSKNGQRKTWQIHILVGQVFLENTNTYLYSSVHHIDNNRQNNHYTNLKWCDAQKNGFYRHLWNNKKRNFNYKTDQEKEKTRQEIIEKTQISSSEIWKPIIGWEGFYEISSHGRVKSLSRKTMRVDNRGNKVEKTLKEKILKPIKAKCRGGDFYLKVRLFKNNEYTQIQIHRLVAEAFIPNPQSLKYPNHKNGIKHQNNIENLEWSNNSENQKHAYQIGLRIPNRGEKVKNSKLTEEIVIKIRNLYASGDYTMRDLGKKFNTDPTNIALVVNRKSWKHVS